MRGLLFDVLNGVLWAGAGFVLGALWREVRLGAWR